LSPSDGSDNLTTMALISYPLGVGGAVTRVIESGGGSQPVLFIHGVMARADRWAANLEPIAAAGYHCYAFDLPGHGFASKGPDFPYGVPAYADFVKAFMAAIGIARAHIVGTSMGGHVAGYFAANNPNMVDALILVDSVGILPFGKEAGERTKATVTNMAREGVETRLQFGFVNQDIVTDEFVDEEFKINNSPGAAEAYAVLGEYFSSQIDNDVIGDALAEYAKTKPVLLIWGEDDKAVPLSVGEQSLEKIKNTELVTVPRSAHFPYIEDPQLFNRTVVEFLHKSNVS
jgi:2-hydroxy-6-oxonona-2,4-dienedioate hydrolase